MAAISRYVGGIGYAGRLGGSFDGKSETAEPDVVTGGGEYSVSAVRSQGKGRKRRYFIEQDGRRLYGTRVELERLLERRAGTPPVSAPAVAIPAVQAAQAVLAPSEVNAMAREAMGAAKAEFERKALAKNYEDAAIALLLLN